MLKNKLAQSVVLKSNLEHDQMSYSDNFSRRIVTPADLKYYQDRQTLDSMLGLINEDILAAPPFEWLPKFILSKEQIDALDRKMVVAADQATLCREICESMLKRKKESVNREVVERVTNVAQDRREMKNQEKAVKVRLKASGVAPVVAPAKEKVSSTAPVVAPRRKRFLQMPQ